MGMTWLPARSAAGATNELPVFKVVFMNDSPAKAGPAGKNGWIGPVLCRLLDGKLKGRLENLSSVAKLSSSHSGRRRYQSGWCAFGLNLPICRHCNWKPMNLPLKSRVRKLSQCFQAILRYATPSA
jgi:hypothetical protein